MAYSPNGDAKLDRFKFTVFYDGLHALVAFVIIFTIMSMHAGSSFIAACAFFQMTMAFGCAFTIYQLVLQIPFFHFLNLTGIFIVSGIGADDVFVFMEAWHRTGREMDAGTSLDNNGPKTTQNKFYILSSVFVLEVGNFILNTHFVFATIHVHTRVHNAPSTPHSIETTREARMVSTLNAAGSSMLVTSLYVNPREGE